jgi:hypothetical protein
MRQENSMDDRAIPRTGLTVPLVLVVASLIAQLPLRGQERFGSIAGLATDPSGAVLPGVSVSVTNRTTNRVFTTATRNDGVYAAQDVEPGRYSVRFEKTGFARYEVPDVLVLLGRTVKVDAPMQVGQIEQTVQVTDAAPLIDTAGTTISHNITAEEFDRLPKGRTFEALGLTSPSVNTGAIEGGFQVNGASSAENNYYIDGVPTTSIIDGRPRQTAVFEHLQEVQVKTGGLEAEYGGALGGVVSAVTKSGGNSFHGDIHYYFFGNRLGAAPPKRLNLNPLDNSTVSYINDKKDKEDNHEPGFSLGGPFLPGKLWFFTSASPRWQRRSNSYLLRNGTEPVTFGRKRHDMSWFNKLSFNPAGRVRTNFTWLYTPAYAAGGLLRYNAAGPNWSSLPGSVARLYNAQGWNQPEQSYAGNVDLALTNTSFLSVRGGRYFLNYKDVGVSSTVPVQWLTSSVSVAGVPPELRQGVGYSNAPRIPKSVYDLTTRSYVQADYNQFVRLAGQHNLKLGVGTQKNVNKVDKGFGQYVFLYWDQSFRTAGARGQYGYYEVDEDHTFGSTAGTVTNLYVQDAWRVHPRLSLNLGLRTEKEVVPSFQRHIKERAFDFSFDQKLAPRLGASFDLLGDGKVKLYGSWGRYFDWTKYDVARAVFGGAIWRRHYRALDTLDVFSLNLQNMPGQNLWEGAAGYQDGRLPGFQYLDPGLKPMSADITIFGAEYEILPQTVFAARYVHNKLNRTIEDFSVLDENGSAQYRFGNPGEGTNVIYPASGATCTARAGERCGFPMPRAVRKYDAMELMLNRRFSRGWFASASYVYSRLYGNYSGLQSTDEVSPEAAGYPYGFAQQFGSESFRPGGNGNRYWDLDESMWDSKGNLGMVGRLPTDRPHAFKLYGSKLFRFGTEVGGFFRITSGTPVTTQVVSRNNVAVYVNGRGDLGRTPVFSQTDLLAAHEVRLGEVKRLRFEFNAMNLFNQKTSQMIFDRLNRREIPGSAGINLSQVDLSKGFDYMALLAQTPAGAGALDPRFQKQDSFSPGFAGRFLVKFVF